MFDLSLNSVTRMQPAFDFCAISMHERKYFYHPEGRFWSHPIKPDKRLRKFIFKLKYVIEFAFALFKRVSMYFSPSDAPLKPSFHLVAACCYHHKRRIEKTESVPFYLWVDKLGLFHIYQLSPLRQETTKWKLGFSMLFRTTQALKYNCCQ